MRNYVEYNTFESNVKNLGYTCYKLDIVYNMADSRCWSAVVNSGCVDGTIIVTFSINRTHYGAHHFDIITQDRTSMNILTADIYDILGDLLGNTEVALDFEETV